MKCSQPKNFNHSHKWYTVCIFPQPPSLYLFNSHLGQAVSHVGTAPQPWGLCRLAMAEGLRHSPVAWARCAPRPLLLTSQLFLREDLVPGSVPAVTRTLHGSPVPWNQYYLILQVGKLRTWEAELPAMFTPCLCSPDSKAHTTFKVWGHFLGHLHVPPVEKDRDANRG